MGNLLVRDIISDESFSDEIDECPDDLAIEIIVEPTPVQRPTFVKSEHSNNLPPLVDININEKEAIVGMNNLIGAGLMTKDAYIKCLMNYVNLFDSTASDTILTLTQVIEMSVTKFPYDKDLEYAILPFMSEIMRRSYNISNDYIDALTDMYTTCMNNGYYRCGRRMIKHIIKRETLADREPSDMFLPKFAGQVLLVASTYPEYPRPLIETLVMKYSASVEWESTKELHHFATLFNLIYLAHNAKLHELGNTLFDTIIYDIKQYRGAKEALECWLTVFIAATTLDSEKPHYLLCRVVNEINDFISSNDNLCESSAGVVDTMVNTLMLSDKYCRGYASTILQSFKMAASAKCSESVAFSLLRNADKLYSDSKNYKEIEPYILLALRQCTDDSIDDVTDICNYLMCQKELLHGDQSDILDTLKRELDGDDSQSVTNSTIVYYKLLKKYNLYFGFNWNYISIGIYRPLEYSECLSYIEKRGIIKLFVSMIGNETIKNYEAIKTTIDKNWDRIVPKHEDYMIHCIAKRDHTKKFIEASAPYVRRCLIN